MKLNLKIIAIKMISPLFMVLLLLIIFVPFLNPFTIRGEITGEFVKATHRGYGDFCGDYPQTTIWLENSTHNQEHFWGERSWFYFGNQYSYVDEMTIGQKYKIWYHQESRPSNTTSGDVFEYFVIDDIKIV